MKFLSTMAPGNLSNNIRRIIDLMYQLKKLLLHLSLILNITLSQN